MTTLTNRCRVCGHFFQIEMSVCPNCHNPIGSVFCYKCGSIINEKDNFCPVCGDNRQEPDLRDSHQRGLKRNPYGPLGIAPDEIDAIDLGLFFRWSSCNLGATHPEKAGSLYAWGETDERTTCDWSNYTRCGGSQGTCYDLGRDIGGTEFDAARTRWKGKWEIPSGKEIEELRDKCTCQWTSINGIDGVRCIGPNGNSIFLPKGHYWLSEPGESGSSALSFNVGKDGISIPFNYQPGRTNLMHVRPVIDSLSFSEIF